MFAFMNKLKTRSRDGMLREMLKEVLWIFRYAVKYRAAIVFYIVAGILSSGMGLASSVASKYLIDAVTGYNKDNLGVIISIILCMAVGGILLSASASRISVRINLKINNEIQAEVFDKIMNTDWEAVSGYHSGDLLNRLNSDVGTVADSVIGWFPSLITKLFQFLGAFAVILYYDSTMALIAVLSAPITLVMSRILVGRMRSYSKSMRQAGSEIMAFNEEALHNIQSIKCFDLKKVFGQSLRKVQNNYINLALKYNKFSVVTSTFMSIVGIGVLYATFGWGVYRLWGGYITYGTMTLFMQLSSSVSDGFRALAGMIPSAIGAATSAGRIMEIVERPQEEAVDLSIIELKEQERKRQDLTLLLSHIDFGYKGRDRVLRDVSLYAAPQEIVALIGPSGKGKTTILQIILGLLNPECGEAMLIDKDGGKLSISPATRRYFAYVPQGNTMFSGTVEDNLRLVKPDATELELTEVLKAADAYDFIKELPDGIHTRIGEKGCGISEGQAQRISIARALLRDAVILLLDEATSALDAETEKKVLRGIMLYGKIHTCILTTHRQSVLKLCDRIFQIDGMSLTELTGNSLQRVVDL